MISFDTFLARRARSYPEKCAVVSEGKRFSYQGLNSRVNQLANGLLSLGVRKGDRIGILLQNGNEIVESIFASSRMGECSVPINFRLAGKEFDYILDNSDASVLVYDEKFTQQMESSRSALTKIKHYISVGKGETDKGVFRYEELLQGHAETEPPRQITMDDDSTLIYTSGTTGKPKGVIRTYQTNLWASLNTAVEMGCRYDDVEMYVAPLFHVSFFNFFTPNIVAGGTGIILPNFDVSEVLKLIEAERVTRLFMVPAMWNLLLNSKDFSQHDLSSLRTVISGAEAMPSKLKTLITKKFSGVEIWEVYGLSEGGKTVLRPADCIRKFASVGKAVGCEEVKLVDDNDIDVGLGKSGEILFRAPSVMKGYYKNPEATAEALKGGWLHTGDVGKFDEEGFLYIVDRKKDMIISGGENIYPREIEEVLASHPKIFEVAVYGVPDRKWGESVKATVVLKEGEIMTEEEVINCCLANLARFKKPRSVEFTDSLPRSASGKILKRELREKHSKI